MDGDIVSALYRGDGGGGGEGIETGTENQKGEEEIGLTFDHLLGRDEEVNWIKLDEHLCRT